MDKRIIDHVANSSMEIFTLAISRCATWSLIDLEIQNDRTHEQRIDDPIAKVAKIIYAIHEEYLDLASYIVVSSPQDENYVLVKCNNCYLEYRYEHHNNHGYSYDCYQCMSTLIFSVIAAMDD